MILNNKILRILQFKDRFSNVNELYSSYSTLNINDLHVSQVLLLSHNLFFIMSYCPLHFKITLCTMHLCTAINTREKDDLHVALFSTSYGICSIAYKAAKLWNNLPNEIKIIANISHF